MLYATSSKYNTRLDDVVINTVLDDVVYNTRIDDVIYITRLHDVICNINLIKRTLLNLSSILSQVGQPSLGLTTYRS